MDHDAVVRLKMTERYLLGELDPDARDEFEEHFFRLPELRSRRPRRNFVREQSRLCWRERSEPLSARLPVTGPNPRKTGMVRMVASGVGCSCNGLVAGCDRVRIWFVSAHAQALNSPRSCLGVSECRHVGCWAPGRFRYVRGKPFWLFFC